MSAERVCRYCGIDLLPNDSLYCSLRCRQDFLSAHRQDIDRPVTAEREGVDVGALRRQVTTTLIATPDHLLGTRTTIVNAGQLTALLDRLEAAEGALARVRGVHERYFDLDGQPGDDDTTPEPEDVWRYDRDLRAALGPAAAADEGGGC